MTHWQTDYLHKFSIVPQRLDDRASENVNIW